MFPFVDYIAAQQASSNRTQGVIVTTPFSVTKNKYQEFMVTKVIQAIKDTWPDRNRKIVIQQDGALAHIRVDDAEFVAAATNLQRPKSPDINVLDLSFFRALQAAQWQQEPARTIDGIIHQVNESFEEFDPQIIDFGFKTLQTCTNDILKVYGNNNHKISRIGKNELLQQGELPIRVAATPSAVHVFNMFRDNNRDQMAAGNNDAAGDNNARAPLQMI
jgi:hypothetical protein